jgi:hypothetical protein
VSEHKRQHGVLRKDTPPEADACHSKTDGKISAMV